MARQWSGAWIRNIGLSLQPCGVLLGESPGLRHHELDSQDSTATG